MQLRSILYLFYFFSSLSSNNIYRGAKLAPTPIIFTVQQNWTLAFPILTKQWKSQRQILQLTVQKKSHKIIKLLFDFVQKRYIIVFIMR